VVGIPKTIDKDLSGTDYTLGFETALNVITEEIDRLRTTAGSHRRIFVVETMGRHAGWLALEGGESSGAYIILIPEYDFDPGKVNELVLEGERRGPVRHHRGGRGSKTLRGFPDWQRTKPSIVSAIRP